MPGLCCFLSFFNITCLCGSLYVPAPALCLAPSPGLGPRPWQPICIYRPWPPICFYQLWPPIFLYQPWPQIFVYRPWPQICVNWPWPKICIYRPWSMFLFLTEIWYLKPKTKLKSNSYILRNFCQIEIFHSLVRKNTIIYLFGV